MRKKLSSVKGKQILVTCLALLVIASGYYRWSVDKTGEALPTSGSALPSGEEKAAGGDAKKDAGKAAGLTRSKARSYHAKWLRELREPGRGYKLMPFVDFILSEGMRGTGISNFNYTWTSSTERTALQLYEYF